MSKTAIILGATGLTGSHLLQLLLEDKRYSKIKIFVRNASGVQHEKLEETVCDLLDLELQSENFKADEVFCCIGTTAKKTPDKTVYKKIDFGIPLSAAKLCKQNQISSLLIISSIGANAKSSIFYTRTKGEMENAVLELQIPKTHIFRPSMIVGSRVETRVGEKIGFFFLKIFGFLLLGSFKKYKMISGENLAKVMLNVANQGASKSIVEADEIQSILKLN